MGHSGNDLANGLLHSICLYHAEAFVNYVWAELLPLSYCISTPLQSMQLYIVGAYLEWLDRKKESRKRLGGIKCFSFIELRGERCYCKDTSHEENLSATYSGTTVKFKEGDAKICLVLGACSSVYGIYSICVDDAAKDSYLSGKKSGLVVSETSFHLLDKKWNDIVGFAWFSA
ncbi:hypothetical protein MTR67_027706 [Solanum verrucosum]|uniref:Uncharacterized protein n=1 Tax=Solanum verrucosum TaxID=315347 RepID=A0AAF0R2R0_SOLVR|nr:hypothetical protein MTR67_027706 [Solanum verrucosum]